MFLSRFSIFLFNIDSLSIRHQFDIRERCSGIRRRNAAPRYFSVFCPRSLEYSAVLLIVCLRKLHQLVRQNVKKKFLKLAVHCLIASLLCIILCMSSFYHCFPGRFGPHKHRRRTIINEEEKSAYFLLEVILPFLS